MTPMEFLVAGKTQKFQKRLAFQDRVCYYKKSG